MPEDYLKFIHSEIATVTKYIGQIYGGDFAKLWDLLRIYDFMYFNVCFAALFSDYLLPYSLTEYKSTANYTRCNEKTDY